MSVLWPTPARLVLGPASIPSMGGRRDSVYMQPELLTLGPATRLVSIDEVSVELGLNRLDTEKWLSELEIEPVTIGSKAYVHLLYLEMALWWLSRPRSLKAKIERSSTPESDLIRQFYHELHQAGRIYVGLKGHILRERLRYDLKPLRPYDPISKRRCSRAVAKSSKQKTKS